jgi:hypothetical protein
MTAIVVLTLFGLLCVLAPTYSVNSRDGRREL